MNTKNLALKCRESAVESKEGFLKYRRHALAAVGVVVIVALAIGAYWFTHSEGESGSAGESAVPSPYSPSRSSMAGNGAASGTTPEYDYSEAPKHIGERATIRGTVIKIFTAKNGVTFFDFCQGFDACPFGAVIFASDLKAFGDLKRYQRAVKMTGIIRSYQNKAEMVLNGPDQIE